MKIIATNKKAFHNFLLGEKWEAGIVLAGSEVKSVRDGGVSFSDSFARVEKGEVFLYNLHINPYQQASYLNPSADRSRKLLLRKKEISKIEGHLAAKGMALVPTRIYFTERGLVKLELALGRGKKLYDKRETIKEREVTRGLKRRMAARRR